MAIGRKPPARGYKQHNAATRQFSHTEQKSTKSRTNDEVEQQIERLSVWAASGRSQPDPSRCFSDSQSPHPYIPELPVVQGELFYECTLFLYSVLCLFLLYLNVYKTAWWLPNSNVHYALKMHLIDPYLLSCIGLLLGRRVTLCFFDKISIIPPEDADDAPGKIVKCFIHIIASLAGILRFIQFVLKVPMFVAVFSSFMFSFLRILQKYQLGLVAFFFGPFVIYLTWFIDDIVTRTRHRLLDPDRVRHACTFSPQHIRTEANILLSDMRYRVKLAGYAATSTCYLSVYLPYRFVPGDIYNNIHVDLWWLISWGFVVFATSFTLFLAYLFPPQYQEMLHRASLHLGTWTLLPQDTEKEGSNIREWSENSLYRSGAIVRRNGALYRASGYPQGVAAQPGHIDHQRFFQISYEPMRLPSALCWMELFIVFVQFYMLITSHEWNHLLTTATLMFANYLLLYKFIKDRVILGKCYDAFRAHKQSNNESADS